jgi:methanogenic corrinoid protein MtbC1
LYSAADIAHLRLLARVVSAGRAIGDVAALSRAELEQLTAHPTPNGKDAESRGALAPQDDFVTRVLEQLQRFDHAAVRRLFGDAVVGLGVRRFLYQAALPLVHQVGARWADRELSIAEEHLLTGILRNLLASLMHSRARHGRPLVLATPAGERHEIGLLLVALLALDAGVNVSYLGVDLPAADIVTAAARAQASVVGLSVVVGKNRARARAEASAIQATLPTDVELWLGGADAANVAAGVQDFRGLVVDDLEATEAELTRIAVQTPLDSK